MKLIGRWTIKAEGEIIASGHNVIVDAGITRVLNMLANNASDYLGYIALGIGSGVPANSDIAMFNELHREPITSYDVIGNKLTISTFMLSGDVTGQITEGGVFFSGGTMFSHYALSIDNQTAPKDLTVDYELEIVNG